MSEPWPVYDIFSPILIGNYIRFETAAKCIANREAGNKDVPVAIKFKIAKEYYEQLSGSESNFSMSGIVQPSSSKTKCALPMSTVFSSTMLEMPCATTYWT